MTTTTQHKSNSNAIGGIVASLWNIELFAELPTSSTVDVLARQLGIDIGAVVTRGDGFAAAQIPLTDADPSNDVLATGDAVEALIAWANTVSGHATTCRRTVSNNIVTYAMQNAEETFDVTLRSGRILITNHNGFGGVSHIDKDDWQTAAGRAYRAYRHALRIHRQ